MKYIPVTFEQACDIVKAYPQTDNEDYFLYLKWEDKLFNRIQRIGYRSIVHQDHLLKKVKNNMKYVAHPLTLSKLGKRFYKLDE